MEVSGGVPSRWCHLRQSWCRFGSTDRRYPHIRGSKLTATSLAAFCLFKPCCAEVDVDVPKLSVSLTTVLKTPRNHQLCRDRQRLTSYACIRHLCVHSKQVDVI